jgi:hypothetical protein
MANFNEKFKSMENNDKLEEDEKLLQIVSIAR